MFSGRKSCGHGSPHTAGCDQVPARRADTAGRGAYTVLETAQI